MLNELYLNYYRDVPNAGDRFSLALAERFFAERVYPFAFPNLSEPNLILVGSYLHNVNCRTVVCGGGFLSAQPKWSTLPAIPRAVHCVRGPLTAELLRRQNVPCPEVYADPGILAPRFFPHICEDPSHDVGLVPHFKDMDHPWLTHCRAKGVRIIDVQSPLDRFFADLTDCRVILSSSLHGIIFAHAYGIPALWIELSDNLIGDGFKFFDYYAGLGIPRDCVDRVRVTDADVPSRLAEYATWHDQLGQWPALDAALDAAGRQLQETEDRGQKLEVRP